jgi:hypothetical protein
MKETECCNCLETKECWAPCDYNPDCCAHYVCEDCICLFDSLKCVVCCRETPLHMLGYSRYDIIRNVFEWKNIVGILPSEISHFYLDMTDADIDTDVFEKLLEPFVNLKSITLLDKKEGYEWRRCSDERVVLRNIKKFKTHRLWEDKPSIEQYYIDRNEWLSKPM